MKNVSKAFGENVIIENSTVEIDRGDKIALIGANGKGKSTLLRILAGVETFSKGERRWGHNVEESFYAQHQLEALNVNNSILDEMKECGSQMNDLELRGLLGCFLFSGDDADKPIRILSGGEKARVALAKVIVSKANFLMLDEPTNHLDMHSCDLLIESLNKYQGSIILVSHDRYFISKTANKIWEIVDHEIKEFKGGYEEWVAWKKRMESGVKGSESGVQSRESGKSLSKWDNNSKRESKKSKEPNKPVIAIEKKHEHSKQDPVNKEQKKELQKQQRLFHQLEEKIAILTKQKAELEASLIDPAVYSDKSKFLQAEAAFKKASEEMKNLNSEYEKVFEKIIDLESK